MGLLCWQCSTNTTKSECVQESVYGVLGPGERRSVKYMSEERIRSPRARKIRSIS